eukprot:4494888-Amphidinium_carterae.2
MDSAAGQRGTAEVIYGEHIGQCNRCAREVHVQGNFPDHGLGLLRLSFPDEEGDVKHSREMSEKHWKHEGYWREQLESDEWPEDQRDENAAAELGLVADRFRQNQCFDSVDSEARCWIVPLMRLKFNMQKVESA